MNISGIAAFAKSLTGDVVLPHDRRYGKLRRVSNRAVNMHPAIIVRCANAEDVRLSVEFARDKGLLTAVRSGGHSFAGHGVCDDGLVTDLSLMKRAWIDPVHEKIRIEPGIIAGELDCLTQSFRMAVPLGSCPTVGVAGYSLGGGESSLTPKFGYGCDSITDLEVVTADDKVLRANASENTDLFWAMRGAGANFGVATLIEFQLHPIETVLSGSLRYPIKQAIRVLHFLDSFAPTIPAELFLIAAVLPHPGERMLDIKVVWTGDKEKGERSLRPLRKYLRPFEDTIQPKAYLDEQRGGFDVPEGEYSSHRRAGHFKRLTDDVVETIIEHASNAPHEASGITMMYWHGPWCARPHDNAFGFRRTGFEYWIHSYWRKTAERGRSWDWVEGFYRAMEPLSTGAVYVNDLENEGVARARAAYGDKYDRLSLIKGKFDPDNFFRVNQNIPPPARRH
ncbi:FAD-binding oxidoreductase [Candidatus Binatus sp.]|uniref:FAD-binding oxidoreductase n=1 Tax=Candidatus Binatus sp. TaxID=2811406 RepID=UPI003CBF4E71